jgi:hypothetical protein
MTAAACEFLRRFFLHVLPKGFIRIRHFGFLVNRQRKALLEKCRELLKPPADSMPPAPVAMESDSTAEVSQCRFAISATW